MKFTKTKHIGGIIAVIRSTSEVDYAPLGEALLEGGVSALEVTLNTPGALEGITLLRKAHGDTIAVGAGTILKPEDAQAAIDAGSSFVVTPTLQLETIALCQRAGLPIVCGAMTPTEILSAHNAGADFVKLFPAGSLGLDYIKAVLAPLPFIRFVPTGGISLENIREFLQICPAVGVGGNMVSAKLIAEKRWSEISFLARAFVEAAA